MYNPEEIENLEMLSSYLRTTKEKLTLFTHGDRFIIDFEDMESLSKLPKERTNCTEFRKFYIPKKNIKLGHRIVYKCYQQFTMDILKILKFNLTNIYLPHNCAHGFIHGKNTRSNALVHLGKKHLLSIDIKDFFESIGKKQVIEAFKSLGFKENIALELGTICTLEDKLVQGFPTSPIIANIVCSRMDDEIQKICIINGANYTRYADDISISSNENFTQINEIDSILKSYQFELNDLKTKRFIRGQNQYVTGLSISDSSYPRIPKPVKKRIRQQLYYIRKYGYHSHICKIMGFDTNTGPSVTNQFVRAIENNLKGWIAYIHSIEPLLAKKLYITFNEIHDIYYAEKIEMFKRKNIFLSMRKDL